MASKTEKMRQQEEEIKKKIVASHRAGLCDKDGNEIPHRVYGRGHTNSVIWPGLPGQGPRNVWPRDDQGSLIGD